MQTRLGRKQTAPRNLAAKALRGPRFAQKIEMNPKAYRRKTRHKTDPLREAEEETDRG